MKAEHSPRHLLAFAALVVTMLLWSGNMVVGRALRDDIPAFMLAFCRWSVAFCVILPFAWRHMIADRAILRGSWKSLLALGLIGVGGFNAFLYTGLHHTTATNASLLQAAMPALIILFDGLIFGERPTMRQISGVALSTLGVLTIICQGRWQALMAMHFGIGDILVLCGVVAWSLYTSLLRLRPPCHPLSFLAVTFGIAAVAMMPLAAIQWDAILAMQWRPPVIGAILYVALFASVIAYAFFNFAVSEVGAVRAGQTNNLLPLFGALLAAPLLNEPLHAYHGYGMALIAAGIGVGWLAGMLRTSQP
ncbi:MAG: DMT family transporter [Sphingomonadaceae bacterium]